MFHGASNGNSIVKIWLVATGFLFLSTAATADSPCDEALTLDLPAEWRGYETGRGAWVRFETFSPSLVAIAVTSPLSDPGEPWLEVRNSRCEPLVSGRDSDVVVLEHMVAQQVLAIQEPGVYFVRVASTDPRRSLGAYTLTLAFDDAGAFRAVNPLDDEPEPDPFGGRPSRAVNPLDDEPEPDPFGGRSFRAVNPLDDEPEPDPLTGPVCHSVAGDDHGSLPACASLVAFSRRMLGEIRNAWLDDMDYFVFTLSRLQSVEISSFGDSDTVGGLFDQSGNRLLVADDGGEGENFRIVKTLVPGRYFVRVEGGRGTEGPYELVVQELN